MYGLGEDFTILETSKIVKDTFPEGIGITLPQVLKWSSKTQDITNFFKIFRLEGPEFIS